MKVGQYFTPYRIFRGYLVPECVLSYQGISTGAKLCLAVMHRYIGKNDKGWPGQQGIADKMVVSLRTVQGYIAELERDGFLESFQQGLGKPNLYRAKWHPIYEEDDATIAGLDTQEFAGLDPQDSAGLDTQEFAGLDPQDSAGLIKEEEGQLKEGQEESTTIPSLDHATIRAAIEKHLGRKLKAPERKTLYAASLDDCQPGRIIDWAKLHGIVAETRRSWPKRERQEAPSRQVRREYHPPTHVEPTLTLSVSWERDETFKTYIAALGSTGKRIDPRKVSAAYTDHWPHGDPEKQKAAIEDAIYLANARKDKPEMVPNPESHLAGKPWEVLRRKNILPERPKNAADLRNEEFLRRIREKQERGRAANNAR